MFSVGDPMPWDPLVISWLFRFNKFRRMATNFAIWWDSLEEPPREGEEWL